MEFPRLVFRSPGPEQCQGGTYAHRSVDDQDAYDAALAQGWHASVPEALNPTTAPAPIIAAPAPEPEPAAVIASPPDAPVDQVPPTRDEMKRKADGLGLTYLHNISNIKLAELIDAALAQG